MKLKKNKQVPVGMLFLVLAIILNRASNISDLVIGILYGISIGVLTIGIINGKSNSQFVEGNNLLVLNKLEQLLTVCKVKTLTI